MGFGVVSQRVRRRRVRKSGGVSFGVAALTDTGAVLAADSLKTVLAAGRISAQRATVKVAQAGPWALMLTGVSSVGGQPLLPQLRAALAGHATLFGGAQAAQNAFGAALSPALPHIPTVLGDGEVFSDIVLACRAGAAWDYARLTYFRDGAGVGQDPQQFKLCPSQVRVVVSGAAQPQLKLLGSDYAEDYGNRLLAANLQRLPAPAAPVPPPAAGLTRHVQAALQAAIATQQLAARPAGWPAGIPVAAGPLQQVVVGQVP